jgi:hypothetical protein
MEHHLKGIHGITEGNLQETGAIIIPIGLCKKIETAIETEDLVDETTVMQKFHLTKKTMRNYLSSGRLKGCFSIAFNNSRWYCMSKLLGLKTIVARLNPKRIITKQKIA